MKKWYNNIDYRNIRIAVGVTILITVVCVLFILFVMVGSTSIMNTTCSSSVIKYIYTKMLYDLPIADLICKLKSIGPEFDVYVGLIGGSLFVIVSFAIIYATMRSYCTYIALIYHFMIPKEERINYWYECVNYKKYTKHLVWSVHRADSIFIIIPSVVIYVIARLADSIVILSRFFDVFPLIYPIVYFIIKAIISAVVKTRQEQKNFGKSQDLVNLIEMNEISTA